MLMRELRVRQVCGVCVCGWCEYEIVLIFFDASNAMLI